MESSQLSGCFAVPHPRFGCLCILGSIACLASQPTICRSAAPTPQSNCKGKRVISEEARATAERCAVRCWAACCRAGGQPDLSGARHRREVRCEALGSVLQAWRAGLVLQGRGAAPSLSPALPLSLSPSCPPEARSIYRRPAVPLPPCLPPKPAPERLWIPEAQAGAGRRAHRGRRRGRPAAQPQRRCVGAVGAGWWACKGVAQGPGLSTPMRFPPTPFFVSSISIRSFRILFSRRRRRQR